MSMAPNIAQEEAIATINGPLLLISCPGSGKTTTLVRRIHHMIEEGVPAENILMVTFTKDAATEMQKKYTALYGVDPGATFCTIHSLCLNILMEEGICRSQDTLSEDRQMNFLLDYLRSRKIFKDAWETAVAASTAISGAKNNYLLPEEMDVPGISKKLLVEIFEDYETWRKDNHLVDFDDMLLMCNDYLKNNPAALEKYQNIYRYVQCDEYQDTNRIQRDILYLLTRKSHNLCVVGDDDQSIYAFRGARPEIMLNFPKDFPDTKIIRMGINYRSAGKIITMSDRLIRRNAVRFDKEFVSYRGKTGVQGYVGLKGFGSRSEEFKTLVSVIEDYHKKGVPYNDMAVLFRTNAQAQGPVTALFDAEIPYYSTESVKSIYESFIFSDIRDYVGLSTGTAGKFALLNVLNHPNRFLKEQAFRGCGYSFDDLADAASYILKTGVKWQYEKALDNIEDWMASFGPGVVRMEDDPLYVMDRMNGPDSIHYDRYLKEYAESHNVDYADLRETYDAIVQDAGNFSTVREWFIHAETSVRKLREKMDMKDKEGVVLTTMHRAKGLEWKVVFIVDADEYITPHKKSMDTPAQIEEERRLFYVAMTRAKDDLYIYNVGTPSRFIKEASEEKKDAGNAQLAQKAGLLPPESIPKYFAGKGVTHKKYGFGRVVRYEPGRIVVKFDSVGEKSFQFPETFCSRIMEYK